jgi:DNA repair exonuclease SbcCD nuclease subunit
LPEVAFIHTADLHLSKVNEDWPELLQWLLDKCMERDAALIVAGDFFDNKEESARTRERVREILDKSPGVAKFILSGNSDAGAFPEGADLGSEVHLLDTPPCTVMSHRGVGIVGFPFVHNSSLRSQLAEYDAPDGPVVAVAHGTYFSKGTSVYFADVRERGGDYFPIYSSDLEDIGACYVALGHYHVQHSSFVHKDTVVCYPGTPLALSSHETGIRTVVSATVDTESGEVDIERVPVPVGIYNLREEAEVFACSEEEALAGIRESLRERADARANMTVRLKGNIHLLERDMNDRLAGLRKEFAAGYARLTLRNETTSYRSLIDQKSLVREYMARLAAIDDLDDETKARALELGLHAFDRAKGRLG